jgi:pimeloyl-ACP methyl ester carboxylesterase
MPYFTYEKVVFNYQSIGEGYPLLVLHGLGGDLSQGLGLLHGLKGYKLLSMDFKSHGDTQYESEANEYNFASFAQDALAFVKHMGYKQILLGGISMGAGVSLRLAVDNPGLVKGLILIRPAWLNQSSPINLHIMLSIADCIKKAGLDKGVCNQLKVDNKGQKRKRLFNLFAIFDKYNFFFFFLLTAFLLFLFL